MWPTKGGGGRRGMPRLALLASIYVCTLLNVCTLAIEERQIVWARHDSTIPSSCVLGQILFRQCLKNLALILAQASYLSMSSAHISQDEKIFLQYCTYRLPDSPSSDSKRLLLARCSSLKNFNSFQ